MNKILGIILCSLLLTSCFDISEEISISKTGGGTYQVTMNLSQIKTMMEALKTDSAKAAEGGVDSFHLGMLKSLKETADKFRIIPGLQNVQYSSNQSTSEYTVGFEFNNITALNTAMKEEGKKDKYIWQKGKFTILDIGINPLTQGDGDVENNEMTKTMMADVKYNLKITVPSKVKKTSNADAIVKRNTLVFNSTLGAIDKSTDVIKMTIKYK